MRATATATLTITMPLAVIYSGIEGPAAALAFWIVSLAAFLCLLATLRWVRAAAFSVVDFFRFPLRQALLVSSVAVACGLGGVLVWSDGTPLRYVLLGTAAIAVNLWFHLLMRTATRRALSREGSKVRGGRKREAQLEVEKTKLQASLDELREKTESLSHLVEENARIRAVLQHAMNVLLGGLEEAKMGRGGIAHLGVADWIEHRCLLTTRDVLKEIAERPEGFEIELGVIRTSQGIIHIDMAAGEYMDRLRAKGGCPEFGSLQDLLDRKARQGGFGDSLAVEFKLNGEDHHMVAFSAGQDFDEIDEQLLGLVATMFVVLNLALAG